MSTFRYPLITDENIHPRVIAYLRREGLDVVDKLTQLLEAAPTLRPPFIAVLQGSKLRIRSLG